MNRAVQVPDDNLAFRPAVHVTLALAGVGNVALGTASAIYNRDRDAHNYLLGPIIVGCRSSVVHSSQGFTWSKLASRVRHLHLKKFAH